MYFFTSCFRIISSSAYIPRSLLVNGFLLLAVAPMSSQATAQQPRNFSAPARLEGATPTIKMAFTIAGTVKEIHARAGDAKKRGSPLVSLLCDDRAAAVKLAQSETQQMQALLDKARNGLRQEERAVVAERANLTEADVTAADRRFQRFEQLKQKGNFISDAELDTLRDVLIAARAKHGATTAEKKLASLPARQEDITLAQAQLGAAQAKQALANAELEKCTLRAPADIVVLRNFVEVGDSVNPLNPTSPIAAITVTDISKLRVRAEVDERDIGNVALGQRVNIISEFDKSLQLQGTVARIEKEMGRRTIRSGDPSEKNDRDVLEVVIDVAPNTAAGGKTASLPIGLRVVAVFGR